MSMNKSETKVGGHEENCLIQDPGSNDILCGRGYISNTHPGNEYFRQIVQKRQDAYGQCKHYQEKSQIVEEIFDVLKKLKPPGRFLTRNESNEASTDKHICWVEISRMKAQDIVLQAFEEGSSAAGSKLEESAMNCTDQKKIQTLGEMKQTPSSTSHGIPSKRVTNDDENESRVGCEDRNSIKRVLSSHDVAIEQQGFTRYETFHPVFRQDLENRMMLTELSAPRLMASWNQYQKQSLQQMNLEAGNYFEAGLSGISIDDFFRSKERAGKSDPLEKRIVCKRVAEALKAMGEHSLADSYSCIR